MTPGTHLTYTAALAAAALRRERETRDTRSPAHVRAAATRAANVKALRDQRLAELRGEG